MAESLGVLPGGMLLMTDCLERHWGQWQWRRRDHRAWGLKSKCEKTLSGTGQGLLLRMALGTLLALVLFALASVSLAQSCPLTAFLALARWVVVGSLLIGSLVIGSLFVGMHWPCCPWHWPLRHRRPLWRWPRCHPPWKKNHQTEQKLNEKEAKWVSSPSSLLCL